LRAKDRKKKPVGMGGKRTDKRKRVRVSTCGGILGTGGVKNRVKKTSERRIRNCWAGGKKRVGIWELWGEWVPSQNWHRKGTRGWNTQEWGEHQAKKTKKMNGRVWESVQPAGFEGLFVDQRVEGN